MKQSGQSGEFELIESLTNGFPVFHQIKKGIGDDAAVVPLPDGSFQLYAADAIVENDHFNRAWSTPEEIGRKAMEVNVSDVAAMGGEPEFALITLTLAKDTPLAWTKKMYRGIRAVCEKYHVTLLGGDITHGKEIVISVTLTGKAQNLTFRNGAKAGDVICATGKTGGSAAGYFLLKNGKELTPYLRKRHCRPVARLDAAKIIAPYATAMIDISDGVASETKHIARQSGLGAIVYGEKLPIHADVFAAEKILGLKPYTCALSGGEDFELLFTLPLEKFDRLKKEFSDFTKIGIMTRESDSFVLISNGKESPLPGGFDHLLSS